MIKDMSKAANDNEDLVKEGLELLLEYASEQDTLEAVRLLGVERFLEALRDSLTGRND